MATQTVNISDFTVNVTTTQQSKQITWTAPVLPGNAIITSQSLQLNCSAPKKGNRNIRLNDTYITAGTLTNVDLGTLLVQSATLAYNSNKNGTGTMTVSNLIYTIEYEIKKPIITILDSDRDKIGVNDRCTIAFQCDVDLQQWEARATLNEIDDGHGVGLLVESGGTLSANTTAYVYVDSAELTNGDLTYRIDIYGQSTDGTWSDG